jgi:solute carrier family 13 (sodium-dependent dicarboxylate transporter), member 2/3/5
VVWHAGIEIYCLSDAAKKRYCCRTMGKSEPLTPSARKRNVSGLYGLIVGPMFAVTAYMVLPDSFSSIEGDMLDLSHEARLTAGLAVWMAVWWMTEAIPVYATALLPLAVLPAGNAIAMRVVASAYANELIFLFMGGFILALAMQRWGLHRRIALTSLRVVGTRPRLVIGGFMITTAVLSMWVSNTATTLMMMPIATSLVDLLVDDSDKDSATGNKFALCLMLGIAYAASIGGLGTIIGSPPNVFVVSYVENELGREISFVEWMFIGVPVVCVFLPIAWFLLTFVIYPVRIRQLGEGVSHLREAYDQLGKVKPGEWAVFLIFVATACAWMTRPVLAKIQIDGHQPLAGLTDAGIAMIAALLLFVIPVDRKATNFVMNWEWAVKLPWGLLILFGGGLSLASALDETGFSAFLGAQAQGLAGLPPWLLTMAIVTVVIFITELTSNTATTAAFVPILAAFAIGLGVPVLALIIPATLAASCAFMLPVATPPNAIVFGTGRITIPEMARAGIWLNLAGVIIITAATYLLIIPFFGGD